MNNQPKVAVLGGGSWATAIVKMLCENLETVGWYMRSIYATEHIKLNKHNPNYLSSAELHPNQLILSNNINKTVENFDILVFAIPSALLTSELKKEYYKNEFPSENKLLPENYLTYGKTNNELKEKIKADLT